MDSKRVKIIPYFYIYFSFLFYTEKNGRNMDYHKIPYYPLFQL